ACIVQVLLGIGSGGLNPNGSVNTENFTSFDTADFSNGGISDLLLAAGTSSLPIGVMLGDGHGGFGALITSGGIDALTINTATGDLDGDGRIDLIEHTTITTSPPPSNFTGLVVLAGDRAGHFPKQPTTSVSTVYR